VKDGGIKNPSLSVRTKWSREDVFWKGRHGRLERTEESSTRWGEETLRLRNDLLGGKEKTGPKTLVCNITQSSGPSGRT